MRVLGVIPARGGSKGLPRKNLARVQGRPLLAWTADAALAATSLDRLVLSTEDEEIAAVGRELGLDVPFMRPARLARDDTPTLDVLLHALSEIEHGEPYYDAVMTLQPTSPLRTVGDINGAVRLLETSGADSVVSLVEPTYHPYKMKTLDEEGAVVDPHFAHGYSHTPRQHLPQFYSLEGSIYLTRRHVLVDQRLILGRNTRPWLVPRERSVNVDTPFDLWLAEKMLARRE